MRGARLVLTVALVALVLVATGCGATENQQAQTAYDYAAAPQAAPDSFGADGAKSALLTEESRSSGGGEAGSAVDMAEPMIIRNASVELRVKNIDEAITSLRAAVTGHDGEIADLSVSSGNGDPRMESASDAGPTYASVTIRVPAEKLDALTTAVAGLGTVLSQSESSSDVTEQAVDMRARLKNLRAEEERLREFLDRATKVSDLLEVQRELSRVRGDIEAMDAQLTYLERQVARATLVVSLSKPGPVVGPDSPWFGLREAFSRGVQAAFFVIQAAITIVIAALPLALIVGLFVWIIVWVVRRRDTRRTDATPETDMVDDGESEQDSI